ncbi:MAG: RluA family pseudouridine synthase [Sinobacteraceae bacterium]|nr:RluA family pseudouridine synthase [Nevskiaceae bacterium]
MSAENKHRGRRVQQAAPRIRSLPQASAGGQPPADRARDRVTHEVVDAGHDDQRIDNFLLRLLPGVPKSHVYSLLRSGQVRVDGGRAKPARRLKAGEKVRIPPVRTAQREAGALHIPPSRVAELRDAIIHEDADYLALSKPAGLAVHGGSGLDFGVIEALRESGKWPFLELAHRLDRDTSGVLLLAKTRPALLRAQAAFRDGAATKRYFALLCERLGAAQDVDAALVRSRQADGERRMAVDEDGKAARTRFVPQAHYPGATLCEVSIFSGRTHQIRVHALALGHPVAGDRKYGTREQHKRLRDAGLKRMFLHAHYLQLPATAEFSELLVAAPLPEALRDFLQRLESSP